MLLERKDLTIDQQRWCTDWLMQFYWAIENGIEEMTNLYVPHRSTNPRTKGTYDPKDGKVDTALKLLSPFLPQPEIWAFMCYIPEQEALEFPGAKVWLYPEEQTEIIDALLDAGVYNLWHRYREGGTYQVWYYHRTHGRMQLTPKARTVTGIEKTGEVLFEYFESAILQDMSKGVLEY